MSKVIHLQPKPKPPTRSELVTRVRALAGDSSNVGFAYPHVQDRMRDRGKTMREIMETLLKGECVKGPDLDQWGDYRIKLQRCVCGKRVQVVVAVREKDLTVITVM